jgi:hypothetical protein
MLLAQQYHGHYAITHLEWNQRGNYLATIDETGKLAIWEQTVSFEDIFTNYVGSWSLNYYSLVNSLMDARILPPLTATSCGISMAEQRKIGKGKRAM